MSKPPPLHLISDEEYEEMVREFRKRPWKPVTDGMGLFKREERGIYTDEGTPGLFYFKATHWRNLK
jgi:hypothetical protein